MENPCKKCIVGPMCSQLCDHKREYGEYWLKQMDKIYKLYYNEKSGTLHNKYMTKDILDFRETVRNNLEDHRDQISRIILRPFGEFNE